MNAEVLRDEPAEVALRKRSTEMPLYDDTFRVHEHGDRHGRSKHGGDEMGEQQAARIEGQAVRDPGPSCEVLAGTLRLALDADRVDPDERHTPGQLA